MLHTWIEFAKGVLSRNAKAFAAYFTTLVAGLLFRKFAVEVPADVVLTVQAAIVAVIVWFTRNEG